MPLDAQPLLSIVIPVFQPGDQEVTALDTLTKILREEDSHIELILVNDSENPLAIEYKSIVNTYKYSITYNHKYNQGRSSAINSGVKKGSAPVIWILDSDCIVSKRSLSEAISFDASKWDMQIGKVINPATNNFWSWYQQSARNLNSAVTTANLIIRKEFFLKAGGFDNNYAVYGFEDKDFYQRLPKDKKVKDGNELVVIHHGMVSLETIKAKFCSAAISGRRFARKFPAAYAKSEYAKVDAAYTSLPMYIILRVLEVVERFTYSLNLHLVEKSKIPFTAKAAIVKFTLAVSYFRSSRMQIS